jgi:glycosyltransferase involved in cell wall biosynthesis
LDFLEDEMEKYLFIATNEWEWGGSEILWSEAAERLARSGAEVRVSIPSFGKPLEPVKRVAAAGGKVFFRQPFSVIARLTRKILPLPGYPEAHIRSVGKGVDLAVITLSSFRESLPWIEAVRSAGLKYVIVVQGASETFWPADNNAARLAICFEDALRSYFVSEANLRLIRRQLSAALRNGRVIRNPFNVRYDARPPWPGDSSERLLLACVARLDVRQKAQDLIIDVLSLPHWRNRSVHVVLAGDGPYKQSLRKMAAMSKLSNVEFAGMVADIEGLWAQRHALVLSSRFEGLPLALVEAMLCGRPCIATDVGGNAELIRDGFSGFLAKAPTVELLDEAMNRAWENRGRLREMGERAARDVRQLVSPDPTGDFVRELTSLMDGGDQREVNSGAKVPLQSVELHR